MFLGLFGSDTPRSQARAPRSSGVPSIERLEDRTLLSATVLQQATSLVRSSHQQADVEIVSAKKEAAAENSDLISYAKQLEQENKRLREKLKEAVEIQGIHRQLVNSVRLRLVTEVLHDNLWKLYD